MNIDELHDGSKKVDVQGKIVKLEEIRTTKTKKQVRDVTLTDSTGMITLVLWNEDIHRVDVGDVVKVEDGYVSSYNDRLQLNVGKWGTLEVVEMGKKAVPNCLSDRPFLLQIAEALEFQASKLLEMAEDCRSQCQ